MTIITEQGTGVVAYYGDEKSFMSIELYDGYVKATYYIGNDAPSLVYSYVKGTSVL